MCGHGMVSHSLAKKMIDWVKEGRRTPEQAAAYMTRFCSCGVFNPGARGARSGTGGARRNPRPHNEGMGFALWIDAEPGLAWAQGTHEYRPLGTAVISFTDQFRRATSGSRGGVRAS